MYSSQNLENTYRKMVVLAAVGELPASMNTQLALLDVDCITNQFSVDFLCVDHSRKFACELLVPQNLKHLKNFRIKCPRFIKEPPPNLIYYFAMPWQNPSSRSLVKSIHNFSRNSAHTDPQEDDMISHKLPATTR